MDQNWFIRAPTQLLTLALEAVPILLHPRLHKSQFRLCESSRTLEFLLAHRETGCSLQSAGSQSLACSVYDNLRSGCQSPKTLRKPDNCSYAVLPAAACRAGKFIGSEQGTSTTRLQTSALFKIAQARAFRVTLSPNRAKYTIT